MTSLIETKPLGLMKTVGLVLGAVIAFTLAYSVPHCGLLMFVFLYCLLMLAKLTTTRGAFYSGWAIGMLAYPIQLWFFYTIFGKAAVLLWMIMSFWLMLFVVLTRLCFANFQPTVAAILIPFLWTGLEYFRSELYYLRFSWLSPGYVFSDFQVLPFHILGVYGVGFILVTFIVIVFIQGRKANATGIILILYFMAAMIYALASPLGSSRLRPHVQVAGAQLEFATESEVIHVLNNLDTTFPQAQLLVLSEYTFQGPVPDRIKTWCREHQHYLIIGGEDPTPDGNYYNTAFVVSTNGEVVFKQAKSVPIQFFKDGLPAPEQKVWESPWGKIGICICYDLSYTRVTDGLIRLGAQAIIVPTMDVSDWGERQHTLHALVAPVRAAEYGVPIFRVASSGISQLVSSGGHVNATAPFQGEGAMIQGDLRFWRAGKLPLDRYLAPFCVLVTAAIVIWLTVISARRKYSSRRSRL